MKIKNDPKLSKKILLVLVLFASFGGESLAYAQADRGGSGGDWSEADLKHFLTRLVPYLSSEEGRTAFPEVAEYDQSHGDATVEKIASELNPRLLPKPVFDSAGNERDCVSYQTPVRYFECNLNSLPRKPSEGASEVQKSEYYGSMYRLVLHEVFVQVGIEKPLTKEVPSDYAISSRLMVHLESFPEWVPGASPYNDSPVTNVELHIAPEWSIEVGGGSAFSMPQLGGGIKLQLPANLGTRELKFGIFAGYYHGIGTYSGWILPLLLTAEYDFHTTFNVAPYLGIEFGASHVYSLYTDFNEILGFENFSYHSWNFTVKIVPGFNFGKHNQYFFEVPVSYLDSTFLVAPSFGIHF